MSNRRSKCAPSFFYKLSIFICTWNFRPVRRDISKTDAGNILKSFNLRKRPVYCFRGFILTLRFFLLRPLRFSIKALYRE